MVIVVVVVDDRVVFPSLLTEVSLVTLTTGEEGTPTWLTDDVVVVTWFKLLISFCGIPCVIELDWPGSEEVVVIVVEEVLTDFPLLEVFFDELLTLGVEEVLVVTVFVVLLALILD